MQIFLKYKIIQRFIDIKNMDQKNTHQNHGSYDTGFLREVGKGTGQRKGT